MTDTLKARVPPSWLEAKDWLFSLQEKNLVVSPSELSRLIDRVEKRGKIDELQWMINLIKGISFVKGFGASTFNRADLTRLLNKKLKELSK